MEYRNKNFSNQALPFEDGDVLIQCNCFQNTQITFDKDLTIDGGNWLNVNLTGNITKIGNFQNAQLQMCYWANIQYAPDGNIVNPLGLAVEPENCPHTDPALVDEIETEEGTVFNYSAEGCRQNRPIGWTP